VFPKPFFSGRKPKIIFIFQGTRVYAKENTTEKQSTVYADCQFPNKNFNYIAREIWIIFDIKIFVYSTISLGILKGVPLKPVLKTLL
jgi:hypothetical protein